MEQRRTRRFQLQLPLSITRTGAERGRWPDEEHQLQGVLFTAEREPDLGGPIEYVITLNPDGAQREPALHRKGPARRTRGRKLGGRPTAYQIAATLERYEFVRDLYTPPYTSLMGPEVLRARLRSTAAKR